MKLKEIRPMIENDSSSKEKLIDSKTNDKYELRGGWIHKDDGNGNFIPHSLVELNQGKIPPEFDKYENKNNLTATELEDFTDAYEDLIHIINNEVPSGVSHHFGEAQRLTNEVIPKWYDDMKILKDKAEAIANRLKIDLSVFQSKLTKLSKIKLGL